MEALKTIPMIFLMLAIAGIIGGAGILTMSKFGDTLSAKCLTNFSYDSANSRCMNSTEVFLAGALHGNMTEEFYGIMQAQTGMTTVTQQFPTIGIIAVMVIIISLIAGTFVYMQYFR